MSSHCNTSDSPACLIASVSGRSLAQAANRAGWRPSVIDLFADLDTQEVSDQTFAADWDNGGFAVTSLKEGATKLDPYGVMPVVYGGGFECAPNRLHDLCGSRELIGNRPELVTSLQSPLEFAALLIKLNIPHPETKLAPPEGSDSAKKWLSKRIGGSGGGHVRFVNGDAKKNETHYYQKFIPGRSMSAMVLSNGKQVQVAGYSEQWRDKTIPSKPFQYGGAVSVSRNSISHTVRESIERAASEIVNVTGLCGLNTFDLIVNSNDWWLLEINPRPGFTFELHEQNFSGDEYSLFEWHIKTASGEIPDYIENQNKSRKAHAVIYASSKIHIPSNWLWPQWVTDIPEAESIIGRGSPVCTVHAENQSLDEAKDQALKRHDSINNTLQDWVL